MQAVILAAGRGTRLQPVTEKRSKAMVPILGRPLVERVIEPLVANGVRDFIIVTSPNDRDIVAHFEAASSTGLSFRFVVQEQRLGTAAALSLAAPLIERPFAVWACDSVVDASHVGDLRAAAAGADAVLSLLDVDRARVSKSAAVDIDGRRVRRIVEKPTPSMLESGTVGSTTVSLPHYLFQPGLLACLTEVPLSPRGEHELQDGIQQLIDDGRRVVGLRAPERRQVSTTADLLDFTLGLLHRAGGTDVAAGAVIARGARLVAPLRVDAGCEVSAGAVIGPDAYLENGSYVGRRARVRRSIVLRGARVEDDEVVDGCVVTPPAER